MYKTHGLTDTPTYNSWKAMRDRCNREGNASYHAYGASGITYCERWSLLENFVEDMGLRPSSTTLDRIDNTKGYFKENCRWADPVQQSRNRKSTNYVIFNGEERMLCELVEEFGLDRSTVHSRFYKKGWTIEESLGIVKKRITKNGTKLITFKGQAKSALFWAEEYNIKRTTLYERLRRGWSIERALEVCN